MAEASKPTGTAAFVEGLYGKLPESWTSTLIAPSAAFWIALAGLFVVLEGDEDNRSSLERAYDWTAAQPQTTQLVLLFGLFSGVSLTALLLEAIVPWFQKVLAGQWYFLNVVGEKLVDRQDEKIRKRREQWGKLAKAIHEKGDIKHLTPDQRMTYERLDTQLGRVPAVKNRRTPTRLGNILESSSSRPEAKYGLAFDVCWPRLWLLLPETARSEVIQARNGMSTWIRVWLWGLLLIGISLLIVILSTAEHPWWIFAWPVTGLVTVIYAHHRLFGSAEVWADTVESCFDLYRKDLYTLVRWPLPSDSAEETTKGELLSVYLWRGLVDGSIRLTDKDGALSEDKEEKEEEEATHQSLLYRIGLWLQSLG